MNCVNHAEIEATAFCRSCGKALCGECRRDAHGTVYCAEHAPAAADASSAPAGPAASAPAAPPPSPPHQDVSPGLALFLGFCFPGVGAIYNGQYAKGLVHALMFGLIVSILSSGASHGMEPLLGFALAALIFYMAFEAYHTALKRRNGQPVDEFSSLLPATGGGGSSMVSAVALVVVGGLLLLHNMDILRFRNLVRFWPVLLILAGIYMLLNRTAGVDSHERQ